MYRINKKSEKGVALILSLIIMTLLLLLTLSAFEMVAVNAQISDNYIKDLQALYIAEAGINHAILRQRINPDNLSGLTNISCGPGKYTFTITETDPVKMEREIKSTGTIGTNSSRTIVANIKIYGSGPYAVLVTSWKEL